MALGNKNGKKNGSSLTTDKATADKAMDEHMKATYGSEPITPTPELYADNRELNAMLTRASQFGELLNNDDGFDDDATEIVKAREVDDYKTIAMLKHIDRALSKDKRMLLPWPGSTKDESENKKTKVGENGSSWGHYMSGEVIYDKPKASGGRGKVETFYGTMLAKTTLGKQVLAEIERISQEKDRAKVEPTKSRLPQDITADEKRFNKRQSNLLSALRNAAKVRIMLEDIRERCPSVIIEWIREPMSDGQLASIPKDADLTLLNVNEASNVVHSPTVFNIWTKPLDDRLLVNAMKQAKQYSIGSFVRWKVDRAIEIAGKDGRHRVTVDDLIKSAQSAPSTPNASTPPAASTLDAKLEQRWKQQDMVDVKRALDGTLTWVRGSSPVEQEQHVAQLMKSLNASDEMNASLYGLYQILRPIYETDKTKVDRATEYWAKAGEKVA